MQQKEELIKKLFHDQCTKEELKTLFQLIQEDSEEVGPEVMEKLFQQMGHIPDYGEEVFSRIKGKILEGIHQPAIIEGRTPIPMRTRRFWALRIVASILVLTSFSWFIWQTAFDQEVYQQTAFGQIKNVSLPDGSLVTLNGNSSLRYSKNWEVGETRTVYLEGEAFFEVTKKPQTQTKFQVLAKGLNIEVLGTSFNVKNRNQSTDVFLEEGQVKVKPEGDQAEEVLLKPGEVVHYSVEKKALTSPQQTSESLQTSWKTGMLVFEEIPLPQILNRLAEFNDFNFLIKTDTLRKEQLTTTVPAHNIEEAISIITKTTGLSVIEEEGVFVFQR